MEQKISPVSTSHIIFLLLDSPSRPRRPHCWGSEVIIRPTTLGRTSQDEWSARRRDFHLTHRTHKTQTSMRPVGFQPAIPASERPANRRLRPRSHWDRASKISLSKISQLFSSSCVLSLPCDIFHGAAAPSGPGYPQYQVFTNTLRHTTRGRTPLDEWSARRRNLYLTRHNTQETNIYAPLCDSNPQFQQGSGHRPTP